ncbi:MAG: prepilin-type N-terminal cleavage/methylation domain-containing protein, partial [Thermoguttaceae bacterium]
MTTLSVRRLSTLNSRRRAMTLIEIMSSILVLSIGLVGVLAAIPFGGFRMAQMNEADNSSLVGRDAVRMMKINGWANPNNWYIVNRTNNSVYDSNPKSILASGGELTGLNLTYPFFVDPLGNSSYTPVFYSSANP